MADRLHFQAAIFDLDGVLTDTARLHATAWKKLIDGYLERRSARSGEVHEPFDPEGDYRRYVDGRPRFEGLRTFLLARGIELPYGSSSDPSGHETVCGLANHKQALFEKVLDEEEVELFDGTIALIEGLRAHGVRVAVASSSRNCRRIVESAGIQDLFEARVDGVTLEELGLAGKPDPDMFVEAARRLEAPVGETIVFEDAVSGVEAGRRGGFGLVVGVAADGAARLPLRLAGADLVAEVTEMNGMTVELLDAWFAEREHRRPSALGERERFREETAGRTPAVFLDYDGTLTPIVSRPDQAVMDPEMREAVARLAKRFPVTIVSGRGRADVERLVGLAEVNYAGSHGFEISGPEGTGGALRHEVASDLVPVIEAASSELQERVGGIDGVVVEPKRFTLAVHYRLVSAEDFPAVEAAVEEVVGERPELRLAHGKKVFELRPGLEWDKGRAVLWLLEALQLEGSDRVPVYIGDDTTDEDAFEALEGRGIGIVVMEAPRPTRAGYALQDPTEVRAFLDWMGES